MNVKSFLAYVELTLVIEDNVPNYLYINLLTDASVLVDVGCARSPDLSVYMTKKFGLTAYGVDPTGKHFLNIRS